MTRQSVDGRQHHRHRESPAHGGAIFNHTFSTVRFNHCTIVSNSAGRRGGGIYLGSGALSLSNSIVAGNIALGGAAEVNVAVNGDYNLFLSPRA